MDLPQIIGFSPALVPPLDSVCALLLKGTFPLFSPYGSFYLLCPVFFASLEFWFNQKKVKIGSRTRESALYCYFFSINASMDMN